MVSNQFGLSIFILMGPIKQATNENNANISHTDVVFRATSVFIVKSQINFKLQNSFGKWDAQTQGLFSGVSEAEIRPHSQCNLGDFFPI